MRVGDEAFVFDGEGHEFRCAIEELNRHETTLSIIEEVASASPESSIELTLALGLLKGEKFDLVVQKATELGVVGVVPLTTRHADIRLRDVNDAAKRVERWRRIAIVAAKQCGRSRVPSISLPKDFSTLVDERSAVENGCSLLFAERGGQSLGAAMARFDSSPAAMLAVIGSEGGWADEEIQRATTAGFGVVTLGGRTMRAETAAIAITTILQFRFGDLK
jgi:16S rRNA (uracil1498-N3)-methyltransferase